MCTPLYSKNVWVEDIGDVDNFSGAWVAISRVPSSYLWAQLGWLEYRFGERHEYYEYFINDALGWRRYKEFAAPPAGYSYYTVLHNPGTSKITMQIRGSTVLSAAVAWTPNDARASGEITSLANQMPGGYAVWQGFSDLHVWYNSAWRFPASWTIDNAYSNYFGNYTNSQTHSIWDRSCVD